MTQFSHPNACAGRTLMYATLVLLIAAPAAEAQFLGGLSESDEIELGRLASEEIENDLELLTDDIVTSYVADLGAALANHSGRNQLTYHFKVVNTGDINAFALPGGFIYVNRGLIEAADTESELVGVLGHEIGHVVARHGAEQAQRASIANVGLRVLDSVFGGGSAGRLGSMAAEMAAAGTFMKFSRDAEREADRLGAENVAASGYRPEGMLTFFEKLDALRVGESNVVESFFASHPSPAERLENIEDLVASLSEDRDFSSDRTRFLAVKERLASIPAPSANEAALDEEVTEAVPSDDEVKADSVTQTAATFPGIETDYEIAALYAPVFRQALGDSPRHDYITRFDFDGDWTGDNNWDNAGDEGYALPSTVYFNVIETRTHYFIHYSVFHPRDYKGGNAAGAGLSELIREGAERFGDYDPTGLAESAVLAHENDMEGAMVIAEKDAGPGAVVYVETLAHNQFLQYRPIRRLAAATGNASETEVQLVDSHPVFYIEPKGHGIEAYHGGDPVADDVHGFVVYSFTGESEQASATSGEQEVGYDLLPMASTLWPAAQAGTNETYGDSFDYGSWTLDVGDATREFEVGIVGSMFRGVVGGRNMARPPWGWFDADEQDRRQGEWFLTPAETVKRHFGLGESFSTIYIHHPVLSVFRQ
jgi:Zn-dependent protease with chaperone function